MHACSSKNSNCKTREARRIIGRMKVSLTNPDREVQVKGPVQVAHLLKHLNLLPEAYLVIRGQDLLTEDEIVQDEDAVEIRAVISGG